MPLSIFLRFLRRPTLRPHIHVRPHKPRPRYTLDFLILEDRNLMSVFTPLLPKMGTEQGNELGLNSVVYTPEGDKGFEQANLPTKKLVTIENNSSSVVYPIFYGANSTINKTSGTVVRIQLDEVGSGYNTTNNPALWPTVVIKNLTRDIPEADRAVAKVKVNGLGQLYGLELISGGAGYQREDKLQVTFDDSANGDKGKDGKATAFVSQYGPDTALYDPKDNKNQTYRGYVGEKDSNGDYALGLLPGHQATVQVPIAFWDGGRLYFATNGPVPLSKETDPGNPLQNNTEWFFNDEKPSYLVAPTDDNPVPLYGANFPDPVTDYANDDAVVLWYHDPSEANDFGFGTPAQLTEMTFRDPKQFHIAPDMPARELDTIVNYDVSYVDSLAMPASMGGTNVPLRGGPDDAPDLDPGQFAWLGSDMSVTEMQQFIAAFTSTNLTPTKGDPGSNGLGTYFGGLGYDQYYMPDDNTPSGRIISITNPKDGLVQLVVPVTGALHEGSTITLSGVTGQTSLNRTWTITNVTSSLEVTIFNLNPEEIKGSGVTSTGGSYQANTTGVHLQKLPAGYQVIADSVNQNVQSGFDATKFSLISGGTKANVETRSTGTATEGSDRITGVNAEQAALLAPGMLWSPVNTSGPDPQPFFPNGTTISEIIQGTPGQNNAEIVMSNPANFARSGQSWTFSGSQFVSKAGEIAANSNEITNLDPSVGIYLRPGMLVTGSQIPAGTFISSASDAISEDFKTIKLTKSIGASSSSGPYSFTGAPYSYVVRKLIDVWYAWADYYVRELRDGPNKAPSGSFQGTTVDNTGRTDENSLIVNVTQSSFDMSLLRVGDVVTATEGALTPNPSGDPSLNYTITRITDTEDERSVELSLPVKATVATKAIFTFAPPEYIVRSEDAPAAPETAGTIPYTLSFADSSAGKNSPLAFARTVYDVMQSFSLLLDPETLLSRSALLLRYSIGGNVGSFETNDGFFNLTGRHTTLPHERTHVELRDEIKSILRGVFNFLDPTVADPVNWYPDPAKPTYGAKLDTGAGPKDIDFGVYNLNPYVWFVHTQLKMSGYGFSLDDDVANTTANTNSIEVAFGGNAYTAPINTTKTPADPPAPDLGNLEAYTGGARFGTQQSKGFIQGRKSPQDFKDEVRISGLSLATVLQLTASTEASDPIGALITGLGLPPGITIRHVTPINPVNGVDQSWVTFQRPTKGWTQPEQDQPVTLFTFSGFTTKLPDKVVPTATSGAPGSVVSITGTGFTGVLGVTFNGIPGTLVQDLIAGIDNKSGLVTIKTSKTAGLVDGDTVTLSGVTGQTELNCPWVVTNVVAGKSFQLLGSSGNDVTSGGGRWIAGTDSALKVIVPSYEPNKDGTTFPGPSGRVGVRTPSGTNYSTLYFTIGNPGTPTFSGIGQQGSTTANGSLNSTVTLFGSGFSGTTAVLFNGSSIPVNLFTTNPSGTELEITIPEGASGTGTFTITVGGTTYTSTGYTFTVNKPVIAATDPFSPASGPVGSIVTIKGTGFTGADDPDNGRVSINGTPATSVAVLDDSTITLRVAPGTTSGQVVVKTSAGTGNSGANIFTVTSYQTPTVTSATPNQGASGALIQLRGTNFTGVNQPGGKITFNGIAATVLTVLDDQNIDVKVPDGVALGSALIVVTNPGNLQSAPFAFTVIAATAPIITSFSPGAGPEGTRVTITGSGFTNTRSVLFGISQTGFDVINDATIIASVPAGASTGPITVRNGLGNGTSSTNFVVGVQPSIQSFTPDHGPASTVVTIRGGGFTAVTNVKFNGVDAAKFTVTDDDSMTAIVPTGATTGRITMSTASGNAATSDKDFTVITIVKPVIDSFSPGSGKAGDLVTIRGSGFTGASSVAFNRVAASEVKVIDDKTIEVRVPDLATTGLISVTNKADTGFSQTNFVVNRPNVPAAITVVSGSPQSSPVNKAFSLPLKAKVTDSSGVALAGINVTFTAPTGGASGKFATGGTSVTVATDANGIATSPVFTANGVSGAYSVTANVTPALATPANFSLTNTKVDANQTYVDALFVAFYGRSGTVAELTPWVNMLATSGRAPVVNGIMRSNEAATRLVASLFDRLLDTKGGNQSVWVNKIMSGETIENVIAGISTTTEFDQRARKSFPGPVNDAFIRELFLLLMNRPIDTATLAGYRRRIAGVGREGVAKEMLALEEFRSGAVRTFFGDPTLSPLPFQPFFANLLRRTTAPTKAEIDGWVKGTQDLLKIEAAFAASDEFFQRVTGSVAPASLAFTTQARVVRRP